MSRFSESYEYDVRGRQSIHVSFEGVVTESVYDSVTGRMTATKLLSVAKRLQQWNNLGGENVQLRFPRSPRSN